MISNYFCKFSYLI